MASTDNILSVMEQVKITPPHLSEENKMMYREAYEKYAEVQVLILKAIDVANQANISILIREKLTPIVNEYLEMQNEMLRIHEPLNNEKIDSIFLQVHGWHKAFFQISSNNRNLMVINTVASYDTQGMERDKDELLRLQLEYRNQSAELNKKQQLADDILKKLENPSTEKVLSDYAKIYEVDAKANDITAGWWLFGAIILVGIFTILIILSICYEWFPAVMKLESIIDGEKSSKEIINIPVLLTKAFLISLILYVIVFCFKQYSIFKNLFVVNQQKMNAFNSYRIFEAAIGEGDTESKKTLLMSLAKTIHESTNTGFLQGKDNPGPNIHNIDISKLNG